MVAIRTIVAAWNAFFSYIIKSKAIKAPPVVAKSRPIDITKFTALSASITFTNYFDCGKSSYAGKCKGRIGARTGICIWIRTLFALPSC